MTLAGGCHCGAVRFEIEASAPIRLLDCNCSICTKTGYLHLIVDTAAFTLQSGADRLETYRFGSGAAQHKFCRTCGVKSFYIPRSHPDGYSVNARCLDDWPLTDVEIEPFDGRNWENARAALG